MAVKNPNKKSMLVGMIWCVLGLALTFISYYYASDGGSFPIFYGAVIYGIYKAGTGLAAHLRELHATSQRHEFVIWGSVGLCGFFLIGALFYMSLDMVTGSPFIEKKQVAHVPEYGVTLTLPAGFTKIEKSEIHETDSSCASTSLYSSDHGYAYVVDLFDYDLPDTAAVESMAYEFAIEALSFSDSTIIYPEIVALGHKQAMRYGGYSFEDDQVFVCHLLVHDGNLILVFCGGSGSEIDPIHIASAEEFVRYNVQLE